MERGLRVKRRLNLAGADFWHWQKSALPVNSYMRWRVILSISLLANLILAFGWLKAGSKHSKTDIASGITNSATATNLRTAVIVRRQFFSWQEVESRDYPTYIKNLREIGCPEQTIRDIIIADVTQMLREKYVTTGERTKPNPKWWTNFRDETSSADSTESMWRERDAVLAQLLGADWALRGFRTANQTNTYQNLILATIELNPVLQGMATDKKQQVAALLASLGPGEGTPPNASQEKATWAKLSEVLSLEQLEAARLHFSSHAEDLRQEFDALPGFATQPEEFRKMFRATESIDEQLAALGDREDDAARQLREKLLTLRDAAFRANLSPARFEQYARLRDPAYLSALEKLANGGDASALGLLYAINREATAEQERIQSDANLSETQREIELKKLELEQLKATAQALGEKIIEDTPPKETVRPEPRKVHTAIAGEGLDRIARIYGVDANALRAANPNVNFEKLSPGTAVNVPLRLIYPLPPPDQQ